jgi:hypothetical protein
LTVHNLGPGPATNAIVTDQFPSGIALVGPFTPSQGSFDPTTGIWMIGTLPNGGSAILIVGAQIQAIGPLVNTATVSSDQLDPDLSNNTSSVAVKGMRTADMISKLFFIDSFDPSTIDPPAAVSAVRQTLAPANTVTSNAGLANGISSSMLQQLAAPSSLGGIPGVSNTNGTPQNSATPLLGSPVNTQNANGSATSGSLGPLFGDTLGGPVDTTGLTSRGQPLAGGGTAASVVPDILSGSVTNPQTAADSFALSPQLAAGSPDSPSSLDALWQCLNEDRLAASLLRSSANLDGSAADLAVIE